MKAISIFGAISVSALIIIFGFKKNDNTANSVDIGVVVSDLQRSLNFYTTVIGMDQVDTWHSSNEMSTKYGVNSGKAFDIINLKLDCDGYVLKYKLNNTLANKSKNSIVYRESENYGFEELGTRYLTINVKDINPFLERIKKNNIKFKLVTFPNGHRVILLHDPDGALVEIAGN